MTREQALQITRVIAAAFEQSWKPSEEAIRVYVEILGVPEIDYDIAREEVIRIQRTPERFAPTAGVIYSRAAELTWERELEHNRRRVREIAEQIVKSAALLEDGGINPHAAGELLRSHPEVQGMRWGRESLQHWIVIQSAMEAAGRKRSLPGADASAIFQRVINNFTGRHMMEVKGSGN